jgi:hypothetical protein
MDTNTLTPYAAWHDFYEWFHGSENWKAETENNREYLRKTNRDVIAENCGVARIRRALDKYAPGRYVFQEAGFCRNV